MTSYAGTSVPVERSQKAIRDLLLKQGARGLQFSEDFDARRINLRFAMEVEGILRTVSVSAVIPEPPGLGKHRTTRRWSHGTYHSTTKTDHDRWAQSERATYRALHYWLKTSFEAVDFGLFSMTDMFLSHFEWMVKGHATTVGALIKPYLPVGGNLLKAPAVAEAIEGELMPDEP